jgi:hypothetical protein
MKRAREVTVEVRGMTCDRERRRQDGIPRPGASGAGSSRCPCSDLPEWW